MSKTNIALNRPVEHDGKTITALDLQPMTAGAYFDAARDAPENASRAELESRVAALCAGVPFAVIRGLSMPDYKKISDWYDAQWVVKPVDGTGADPLVGGAKPTS